MLYVSQAGQHLILLVWLNLMDEQMIEIKSPSSSRSTGEPVSVGVHAARATSQHHTPWHRAQPSNLGHMHTNSVLIYQASKLAKANRCTCLICLFPLARRVIIFLFIPTRAIIKYWPQAIQFHSIITCEKLLTDILLPSTWQKLVNPLGTNF